MGVSHCAKPALTSLHYWNVVNSTCCSQIVHSQTFTWLRRSPCIATNKATSRGDDESCLFYNITMWQSNTLSPLTQTKAVYGSKWAPWCNGKLCSVASWLLFFLAPNVPSASRCPAPAKMSIKKKIIWWRDPMETLQLWERVIHSFHDRRTIHFAIACHISFWQTASWHLKRAVNQNASLKNRKRQFMLFFSTHTFIFLPSITQSIGHHFTDDCVSKICSHFEYQM